MVNIKGATVVVTGGQRGLGKAIVDEFLQRGAAKVYATARAPKPSEDPRVVSVELDVTKADSVAALAVTAFSVRRSCSRATSRKSGRSSRPTTSARFGSPRH
jgi:NAD(P)-dependent dehydrogenase (short-subunit alcohol dehydrogenase family)